MEELRSKTKRRITLGPLEDGSPVGEERTLEVTPDGVLRTDVTTHIRFLQCGHALDAEGGVGGSCVVCERKTCGRPSCFRTCRECGRGLCGRHFFTGSYADRWRCRSCSWRRALLGACTALGRGLLALVCLPVTVLFFLLGMLDEEEGES